MALKYTKTGDILVTDTKTLSAEPNWEDADSLTREEYYDRLNACIRFYTFYGEPKDFHQWLVEWLKSSKTIDSEDLKTIKKASPTAITGTCGKLARMLMRGMPDTAPEGPNGETDKQTRSQWIRNEILEFLGIRFAEKKLVSPNEGKISLSQSDTIKNIVRVYAIGELETWLDNVTQMSPNKNKYPELDIVSILTSLEIPKNAVEPVKAWLENIQTELSIAYGITPDEDADQIIEGWSYLKRYQLKRLLKIIEDNLTGLKTYTNASTSKPRSGSAKQIVKKRKPKATQVKSIEVITDKVHDGVKGLSKFSIPNSKLVVIYRPDKRQIALAVSANAMGVTCAGKSIRDMDVSKSITFTLRSGILKEALEVFTNGNRTEINKFVKEKIKTAKRPFTGRILPHHMIIRTI